MPASSGYVPTARIARDIRERNSTIGIARSQRAAKRAFVDQRLALKLIKQEAKRAVQQIAKPQSIPESIPTNRPGTPIPQNPQPTQPKLTPVQERRADHLKHLRILAEQSSESIRARIRNMFTQHNREYPEHSQIKCITTATRDPDYIQKMVQRNLGKARFDLITFLDYEITSKDLEQAGTLDYTVGKVCSRYVRQIVSAVERIIDNNHARIVVVDYLADHASNPAMPMEHCKYLGRLSFFSY